MGWKLSTKNSFSPSLRGGVFISKKILLLPVKKKNLTSPNNVVVASFPTIRNRSLLSLGHLVPTIPNRSLLSLGHSVLMIRNWSLLSLGHLVPTIRNWSLLSLGHSVPTICNRSLPPSGK